LVDGRAGVYISENADIVGPSGMAMIEGMSNYCEITA